MIIDKVIIQESRLSLKENMHVLKEELNAEEKFFENTIRAERFVKQYRKPLIAGASAIVLGVMGLVSYNIYQEKRSESANSALNTLLMNPADTSALEALQSNNPALYDLYTFSKAIQAGDVKALEALKGSKSSEIADLAAYESAVLEKKIPALEGYSKTQGALLGDMATVEVAVNAIEKGDVATAHSKLNQIKEDSVLYPFAQMFSHFGVK